MSRETAGPALRRFTLGSGPLKRGSDRLEFLSRILLAGVLLIAVAIALTVGTAVLTGGRSEAAVQAAERQQATARLQDDATSSSDASGQALATGRATAVWTAPSGDEHTGVVPVPTGAEAGDTVSIWVDREGNRTTRPLTSGDVAGRALGYAILTYVAIGMLAWGAHDTFRRMLDRGRYRRWAAEWAVVGPVWTRRVP